MRILGIDPGLERIGVGIIDKNGSKLTAVHYELIQTPRILLPDRLKLVHDQITQLIEKYQPDHVATERLLFAKNTTTALDVSKSLGAILLAIAKSGIPWTEYSPPEIKQSVVGNGRAEKHQVQFMVARILALKDIEKQDDVADALGIAITHAFRGSLNNRPQTLG